MDERQARTVLGLSPEVRVNPGDVERAFRRQARVSHPDAGGDAEAFRDLVIARRTLRDEPLPVLVADGSPQRPTPVIVVPNPTWWRAILAAVRARRASRTRPPRVQ